MSSLSTAQAYAHCLRIAQGHYENFPVASRLLPAQIRGPVAAIYAVARRGDDLADEGSLSAAERLAGLQALGQAVECAAQGQPEDDPVMIALADTFSRHRVPVALLHDLLSAFAQDVTQTRYADFAQLSDYCRRSANPIGRMLLHLCGYREEALLLKSDAICTALQLINFYQDLRQDYAEMGRIYLPQDEMQRFGVSESHIAQAISDAPMQALMQFQFTRVERLLAEGRPLGAQVSGRFGLELRLIIAAGQRVLWHLKGQERDLFSRPRLPRKDYLWIVMQALYPPAWK